MTENELRCPECGNPMTKAGGGWLGRTKCQQYRCLACGRRSVRPLDNEGNKVDAKPFISEAKVK